MHELSICGSIVEIVGRHAQDRRVETIHVQVGQLRQIVPETLTYCWSLVSADTVLAGSILDVESIKATLECQACGRTSLIDDAGAFRCVSCDGIDVRLVSGEEFLITSLDLAEA